MAADWIKMRVDLADDPAVIAIATRLSLPEDLVVGKLHRLWSWFDQQTTDGNAARVTPAWINRRIDCDGFAEAMQQEGWLVITPDGIQLPRFDRHNGKTGKSRALTAKRVATHKAVTNAKGNAPSVTNGNGDSVSDALPRIEENREEKNTPPPTSSGKVVAFAAPPGWEEVEDGLRRLKVALISKAITSAKAHGFTPPQVLALIEYLESNPKGSTAPHGAIFNRLVEQAADAVDWNATEHWPWSDTVPATTDPRAVPGTEQTSQRLADERAHARSVSQETDRLVAAHASTLRAMPEGAVEELIQRAPDKQRDSILRIYRAKGRDSPLVHLELLRLLDQYPLGTQS